MEGHRVTARRRYSRKTTALGTGYDGRDLVAIYSERVRFIFEIQSGRRSLNERQSHTSTNTHRAD